MNASLIRIATAMLLLLIVSLDGHSQASFVNLDFEQSSVPLLFDPGIVPIADALPGWSGYIGGSQVDQVIYNSRNIDAAGISLQSATSPFLQPLQGNYSGWFQGSSPSSASASAAIAQTGLIPQTARSLVFFSTSYSTLQVTFAGQLVPLIQLGANTTYVVMGGDVSQFAQQIGELRFTVPPSSVGVLDNIHFSTQPIPEPRTLVVFGAGLFSFGVLWLWRKRATVFWRRAGFWSGMLRD